MQMELSLLVTGLQIGRLSGWAQGNSKGPSMQKNEAEDSEKVK